MYLAPNASCAKSANALSLAEHRADEAGIVEFRNARSELEIWLILISLLFAISKRKNQDWPFEIRELQNSSG